MRFFFVLSMLIFAVIALNGAANDNDWLNTNKIRWEDNLYEYFIGQSGFLDDEAKAQETAILDAKRLLSEEILTQITSEITDSIDETTIKNNLIIIDNSANENNISENYEKIKKEYIEKSSSKIESKSTAMLNGVKVIPALYKSKGFAKNKTYKYKALIKLTKNEYNELVNRPKEEEKLKINSILQKIETAKKMVQKHNIGEALLILDGCYIELNELMFFMPERNETANLFYDLTSSISANITVKDISDTSNNGSIKYKLLFLYKNIPISSLKIKISDNFEYVDANYNRLTDNKGEVNIDINKCLKNGKFTVFVGVDSVINIINKRGMALNLEGIPQNKRVFGIVIEHLLINSPDNSTSVDNNYFDKEITGFLLDKGESVSPIDSSDSYVLKILKNKGQYTNFFLELGSACNARYIITGTASCSISDNGDGFFKGKSLILLTVYDCYTDQKLSERKFETNKFIQGKQTEQIAFASFKELRSLVLRYLDKEVISQ